MYLFAYTTMQFDWHLSHVAYIYITKKVNPIWFNCQLIEVFWLKLG